MNVVKRSEYCNGVSVSSRLLKDIPLGTIFRGSIGPYSEHIWIMSPEKAVCLGDAGPRMEVGKLSTVGCELVKGYEVLNATLVIEGE